MFMEQCLTAMSDPLENAGQNSPESSLSKPTMVVTAKESVTCRVIGLWAKPHVPKPLEGEVPQPSEPAESEPRFPAELSEALNEFSTRLGVPFNYPQVLLPNRKPR